MTPNGYLLALTVPGSRQDTGPRVFHAFPGTRLLFSAAAAGVSNGLYLLPVAGNDGRELGERLRANGLLAPFSLAPFILPLRGADVKLVREAFAGAGLDARNVTDNDLTLFLASCLAGQYQYYIHFDHGQAEGGQYKIEIRRLEDHPEFSPDWLPDGGGEPSLQPADDKGDTVDVVSVTLTSRGEDDKPPPPPRSL